MHMLNKSEVKNPKLLVLCQLFYPELVSTGQTLTELCEELVLLGVDVEVICAMPSILDTKSRIPKYIDYEGIRIRRVWGTRFPKLNLFGRVINQVTFVGSAFFYLLFASSKRPVLVLTNPPFLAITCALLRILRIGGPYIYLIFDIYPDTAVRLGILKEKGLLSRIWERLNIFVFKYSSAIIVIGRCMKEVVTRKMDEAGLRMNGKLHKIHVWSDDNLIRSALGKDNPLVAKWNLDGKFVVGYFGNMARFHDMETIIGAAKVLKDHPDICFLFIGEGHKKQLIKGYANKYKLQNCQFHSYVNRGELGHLMSSANIGIVSLLEGQEGLSVPSKAFGLMAAGVPIIAIMPTSSEIARIVQEEQCGVVVKPGQEKHLAECILELYNEPERLRIMGNNASKAIEAKYNLSAAAKQYYDLVVKIGSTKI